MAEDREPAFRAEGLLEQIAETALDDDYYVVRAGPYKQSREFNTVLTGVVLAVFAVLVATAAIQTRSDRPATQQERTQLISDVSSRKKLIASRESDAGQLRTQVQELKASVVSFDPAYELLRVQASDRAARGPGITVQVTPLAEGTVGGSITDHDLQVLVNALWYAGAEAVAINGRRIGTLTSIRTAGGVIKVNYLSVAPPYDVVALGDSNSLRDRFTETAVGQSWAQRRDDAQVQFSVAGSSDLTVGATVGDRLTIRHATAIEGDE